MGRGAHHCHRISLHCSCEWVASACRMGVIVVRGGENADSATEAAIDAGAEDVDDLEAVLSIKGSGTHGHIL